MLTILVEIMMSVFIANFKASEHPIINIVVRGILIMITIFFLGLFSSLVNGREISVGFTLMVSFVGGLVISILVFLIEFICDYIWGKEK
ncbi:hypothetical protein ACG9XS_01755 [Acinetobacter gyllenbergii]|uniref:hypothetical protein n=1 Tax=Acinetobacter gyllenbergii TaxID=134534 RepID=UPI003AF49E2C